MRMSSSDPPAASPATGTERATAPDTEGEPPAPPDVSPSPSGGRRANRALLAGLATLAVGVAVVVTTRDWRPPVEPNGTLERGIAVGAWDQCKRTVTERLPATPAVRFPWFDERAIRREADGVFVVRASADATGPAGATIRIPFVCRVRRLGADRWLDDGTVVQLP
jgi:hypothetical protein